MPNTYKRHSCTSAHTEKATRGRQSRRRRRRRRWVASVLAGRSSPNKILSQAESSKKLHNWLRNSKIVSNNSPSLFNFAIVFGNLKWGPVLCFNGIFGYRNIFSTQWIFSWFPARSVNYYKRSISVQCKTWGQHQRSSGWRGVQLSRLPQGTRATEGFVKFHKLPFIISSHWTFLSLNKYFSTPELLGSA